MNTRILPALISLVALSYSYGCAAPKILTQATISDDAITKSQLGAALAKNKWECKLAESSDTGIFVACLGEPANLFVEVHSHKVSAPYASFFTSWTQPLCSDSVFRARVDAFNGREFGTTAYCSATEKGVSTLSFRIDSYLPHAGLGSLELSAFVHRWVEQTIEQGNALGLFASADEEAEEPTPASKDRTK